MSPKDYAIGFGISAVTGGVAGGIANKISGNKGTNFWTGKKIVDPRISVGIPKVESVVDDLGNSVSGKLDLNPDPIKANYGVGSKESKFFFEGAKYSDKIIRQMDKADDIFHAFPKSVDGYATKFGEWSLQVGADGKTYQWLKMPGSYGGKTGRVLTFRGFYYFCQKKWKFRAKNADVLTILVMASLVKNSVINVVPADVILSREMPE